MKKQMTKNKTVVNSLGAQPFDIYVVKMHTNQTQQKTLKKSHQKLISIDNDKKPTTTKTTTTSAI